jgi:protein-disulfide isomerase
LFSRERPLPGKTLAVPQKHLLYYLRMHSANIRLVILFVSLTSCCLWVSAGDKSSPTVAKGKGFSLQQEEVEKEAASKMKELELERLRAPARIKKQRHLILTETMRSMAASKLLSMEAGERGISVEELIELEITTKIKPLTEGEMDKLFELNKTRLKGSREEINNQITSYVMGQREKEARKIYTEELAIRYEVEYSMPPVRFNIATAGHPVFGPEDAPVTIIEFSDFECPHCSKAPAELHKIYDEFEGKIRIIFRQYPLTLIHKKSWKAAEAALCAGEQGKFWEMHNLLFSGQDKLEINDLKEKAAQLELDQKKFDTSLDSGRYSEAVNLDLIEGSKAGVSGTPALFINGRPFEGRLTYDNIRQMVLEELPRNNNSE